MQHQFWSTSLYYFAWTFMYSNMETDFAKLKENAQLPYKQDQLILMAGGANTTTRVGFTA